MQGGTRVFVDNESTCAAGSQSATVDKTGAAIVRADVLGEKSGAECGSFGGVDCF